MKNKENRKVPKRVLKTLQIVRDSGAVNMFDKYNVCMMCDMIDHPSGLWLYNFCGGKCKQAYQNYSIILEQFSNYLKEQNEISNSKTG